VKNSKYENYIEECMNKIPGILSYENKRKYFKDYIKKIVPKYEEDVLHIEVSRENIFRDAYDQLHSVSKKSLLKRLYVNFIGEKGQDDGGLTRDFFTDLSK
jgi:hypothetical protein